MPPKVEPTVGEFKNFENELLKMGFKRISSREFLEDFARLRKPIPSHSNGREVGFSFSANNLTVKVWTSWLQKEERVRELDAGWVLICHGQKVPYYSRPLSRTKNFLYNLLASAWIAKWRVVNRPKCDTCNKFMKITFGRALKQRYWVCNRIRLHDNRHTTVKPWDLGGLPPKAQRYVDYRRSVRRKYKARLKKEGRLVEPAVLKRVRTRYLV